MSSSFQSIITGSGSVQDNLVENLSNQNAGGRWNILIGDGNSA